MKFRVSRIPNYLRAIRENPSLVRYALTHPSFEKLMAHYTLTTVSTASTSFHNDGILHELISRTIESFCIRTFFETGTFKGESLRFAIRKFGNRLNYISCEIDKEIFDFASIQLAKDNSIGVEAKRKVVLLNGTSPALIRKTSQDGTAVPPVLYWLDAHWYSNLPLLDELKEILGSSQEAVIMIDDFKVPQSSPFSGRFDSYGDVELSLDYIGNTLRLYGEASSYAILFPNYDDDSAHSAGNLRGYVAIYFNAKEKYRAFRETNLGFLRQNFVFWNIESGRGEAI